MQILCFSAFEKLAEKVCFRKNSRFKIAFFGLSATYQQPFSMRKRCLSTKTYCFCSANRIGLPSKTTAFVLQNDTICSAKRPLLPSNDCTFLAHLLRCAVESAYYQQLTTAHSKLAKNRLSNLFRVFRRFSEGEKCKYRARSGYLNSPNARSPLVIFRGTLQ